jgi:hypothetical protein
MSDYEIYQQAKLNLLAILFKGTTIKPKEKDK